MFDFSWAYSLEGLYSLFVLIVLELILAVDNVLILAVLTSKLPASQQNKALKLGLVLAMLMRLGMLAAVSWLMTLNAPLVSLFDHSFSGKELFLLCGGLFLIYKATTELFAHSEGIEHHEDSSTSTTSFPLTIVQIVILDAVFGLDSLLGAIGMTENLSVIGVAIIITVSLMMVIAKPVARYLDNNPSLKTLGLAFVLLIGVVLCSEGLGHHFPKALLYFGLGFSLAVEFINIRRRGKIAKPAQQN